MDKYPVFKTVLFIRILVVLLFVISFCSSSSLLWANPPGEIAIQLPSLKTDEEKFEALIEIKKRVPKLFSDAAKYDIDLMALLGDEEALHTRLMSNPEYLVEFKKKKFHEFIITPPKEGIHVTALKIRSEAVEAWKESIRFTLSQLKKVSQGKDPGEAFASQMNIYTQELRDAKPSLEAKSFIKAITDVYENRESFNRMMKLPNPKKLGTLGILVENLGSLKVPPSEATLLKMKETLHNLLIEKELDHLTETWAALFSQGRFYDLGANFNLKVEWVALENVVDALRSEDLIHLSDKNDVLVPLIRDHLPGVHCSDDRKIQVIEGVSRLLSFYSKQVESVGERAKEPLTLTQVPPVLGIFRGCTGGDCSSTLSFPYPNDPYEQVYFIKDSLGEVKGYVSATRVLAGGEPALYVITVSGNHVTAGDTELILRAFEIKKEALGVKHILLPHFNRIPELMNFPAPRGIYEKYTVNHDWVPIEYQGLKVRKQIEGYVSEMGYNQALYDHSDRNTEGVVFHVRDQHSKKIHVSHSELLMIPFRPLALENIDMSDVIEFLIVLRDSHREALEHRLLSIPAIKKLLPAKSLKEFFSLLGSCQDVQGQALPIQTWMEKLEMSLKELGVAQGKEFLKLHPQLLYPGQAFCGDAYTPEFLEATAKMIAKDFSESGSSLAGIPMKLYESHRLVLLTILSFKKLVNDALTRVAANDSSVREAAIEAIWGIRPVDSAAHHALARALGDPEFGVRVTAENALADLQPSDVGTGEIIIQFIRQGDPATRNSVVIALGLINSKDPAVHQALAHVLLNDAVVEVRTSAAFALGRVKPKGPLLHLALVAALRDREDSVRSSAASALSKIHSTDPKVLHELIVLLKSRDVESRKLAAKILNETRPKILESFPSIDHYIAGSCSQPIGGLVSRYILDRVLKILSGAHSEKEPANE